VLRGIYQYLLPLPIWQTIPPFIQLHIVAQSLHSFSRNEKEGKKWLPHNIRSNKRGKREENSCKNSYQRDPIKLGSCLCGRQSLPRDRLAGSPSQQLAQLASPSSSSTREKFAAVMLMHTLLTIASISRSHPPYERTRHIDQNQNKTLEQKGKNPGKFTAGGYSWSGNIRQKTYQYAPLKVFWNTRIYPVLVARLWRITGAVRSGGRSRAIERAAWRRLASPPCSLQEKQQPWRERGRGSGSGSF